MLENNKLKTNASSFTGRSEAPLYGCSCALFTFPHSIFIWVCIVDTIPFYAHIVPRNSWMHSALSHRHHLSRAALGVYVCVRVCTFERLFSNAVRVYQTVCELAIVIRITHCNRLHLTAYSDVNKLFPVSMASPRHISYVVTLCTNAWPLYVPHTHYRHCSAAHIYTKYYFVRWI